MFLAKKEGNKIKKIDKTEKNGSWNYIPNKVT